MPSGRFPVRRFLTPIPIESEYRMKPFLRAFCLTILLFLLAGTLPLSAATTLTEGVSILNPRQNVHGVGYEWHNPSDTLTLTDLSIDTEDEYGLKLPDGATVILKGRNTIRASVAALYLEGNVIFRGTGSLTLTGGEYGILCNGTKSNKKLTLTAGTYTITGGTDGIHSESQTVTLGGGNVTVSGGRYAVNARELTTGNNVTITAEGSFHTTYNMLLQSSNLTIVSQEPALLTDKYIKLDGMTLRGGDNLASLSVLDSYLDEKVLCTVSTFDGGRKSILFGGLVPLAVDVLILCAVLLALAGVILIPILLHRRKAEALLAARDAEKKKTGAAKNRSR